MAKNVVRYWMGETSGQISFVGLHGDRASTPNESQEKAYLGQLLFCSLWDLIWTLESVSFPSKAFAYLLF